MALRPGTAALQARIIELRQQNLSYEAISAEVGLTKSRVAQLTPPDLRGFMAPRSTTPPEVVAEIHRLRGSGSTQREIATLTGYSVAHVSRILAGPDREHRRVGTADEKSEVVARYRERETIQSLAERFGRSVSTIVDWINEAGALGDRLPSIEVEERRQQALDHRMKKQQLADDILNRWDAGGTIARSLTCGHNTVKRRLDERRPAERLARTSAPRPLERACAGCGEVALVSTFPPRPDRPGRHHARCWACLRDWHREWQSTNPERNREGVRRRRARLRSARTEPYRDAEIFERDAGRCWFCSEQVDPDLSFPDPMAAVVHHLHPIAKSGPDIRKNVALAHYRCNHKAKDAYASPFSRYVVAQIESKVARQLIVTKHYLHRATPSSYYFGLYDADDVVVGVVAFGVAPSNRIAKSVTLDAEVKVICLNRLWIDDGVPHGAGSYFLSRALRMLPPALVVAYSDTEVLDPRYGSTHTGGIYRACSFSYSGLSRPNTEWRIPGQGHNVGPSYPGAERFVVTPKARYWTATGTPAQRRALRKRCAWPSLPVT